MCADGVDRLYDCMCVDNKTFAAIAVIEATNSDKSDEAVHKDALYDGANCQHPYRKASLEASPAS